MKSGRDRLLLWTTLAVWAVAYVVWTSQWLYGDNHFLIERALRRILTCSFGIACCWVMKLALDRIGNWSIRRRVVVAIGLCTLCALAYAVVNTIVFYTIIPRWGSASFGDILDLAEIVGFLFFAWTGLYFAIDSNASANETRLRLAEARGEALRARNQALAQQINPHFLFNALNTVSELIVERQSARAEQVTVSLAALLRRSLDTEGSETVTLANEMQAVRQYLDIEQTRFGDRMIVTENIPADLRDLLVPPMILQPLVENAVKHGVARSVDPVAIHISAELRDGRLRIAVCDDALPVAGGSRAAGLQIGQGNIRQRLALLYGPTASLSCAHRGGRGYSAVLSLPTTGDALA